MEKGPSFITFYVITIRYKSWPACGDLYDFTYNFSLNYSLGSIIGSNINCFFGKVIHFIPQNNTAFDYLGALIYPPWSNFIAINLCPFCKTFFCIFSFYTVLVWFILYRFDQKRITKIDLQIRKCELILF